MALTPPTPTGMRKMTPRGDDGLLQAPGKQASICTMLSVPTPTLRRTLHTGRACHPVPRPCRRAALAWAPGYILGQVVCGRDVARRGVGHFGQDCRPENQPPDRHARAHRPRHARGRACSKTGTQGGGQGGNDGGDLLWDTRAARHPARRPAARRGRRRTAQTLPGARQRDARMRAARA